MTIIIIAVGIAIIVAGCLLLRAVRRSRRHDFRLDGHPELEVSIPAFLNAVIPDRHSGNGEDISPAILLEGLSAEAVSIAVIMDDLDIPVVGVYNHWTIWNIPPMAVIPEGVAHGATVPELGGAAQGVGYGRHCYRGPKPPFGTHRYRFHVFALDTMLALDADAGKKALVAAMEGHILQYGWSTGLYPG